MLYIDKCSNCNNLLSKEQERLLDVFADKMFALKEIKAQDAISKMIEDNFRYKKMCEWGGAFFEYSFDAYMKETKCENLFCYVGDKKNQHFDCYSVESKAFFDLKASDITHTLAPGNDKKRMADSINENGVLYFIVCEHETEYDRYHNYEQARARMKLLNIPYRGKISYKDRMKNSICFKSLKVFAFEDSDLEKMKTFNQGGQYITKEKRNPKYFIDKTSVNNLVYSREAKYG